MRGPTWMPRPVGELAIAVTADQEQPPAPLTPGAESDPGRMGAVELVTALRRRELSAVEITQAFLDRIDRLNGPATFAGDTGRINAFARIDAQTALTAAAAADRRRQADPDDAPPLCGVPVALKDLIAVAGRPVSASSVVLADAPPADRDSTVWATLRAQGLVHLGHVHTHEFAAGGTTDQVGNPWDLARSAGGSSGGSAAAVAARLVPLSVGTDTMGSVRIPAALTGTSAIKPTQGAISTRGVIPLAPSLDDIGPMARTIADAALLLGGLTGNDFPLTPRTGRRPLDGTRIAVTHRIAADRCDPDVLDGLDRAIRAAQSSGAEIVELTAGPAPDTALAGTIIRYEMAAHHRAYAGRRAHYRPMVRDQLDAIGPGPTRADYDAALERRRTLSQAWERWFAEHDIDAVLEPTVVMTAPLRAAPGSGVQDDPAVHQRLSEHPALWNLTGQPVVALPAGLGQRTRLPVGVSLAGRRNIETRLLQDALDLQAALGVSEPPLSGTSRPDQ